MRLITVYENEDRIDKFLLNELDISRSKLQKLIESVIILEKKKLYL